MGSELRNYACRSSDIQVLFIVFGEILDLSAIRGDNDTHTDFFLDQAPSFAWPFAKTGRIKNSRSARATKRDRCRITAESSCAWRKAYALLLLFHRNEVVVRIAVISLL